MNIIKLKSKQEESVLEQIKIQSEDGLVLCFAGVGSAWARKNHNTSLIVAKNRKTLLVDLGSNVPHSMESMGVDWLDFDYYHFTHSHADHIGAVEEFLLKMRYIKNRKANVIITHEYQQILWNESLKGGCEINEDGMLRFTDFVNIVRPNWVADQPREKYFINLDNTLKIELFRTFHVPGGVNNWEKAFWSTGLILDEKVLFTADTRFDSTIFSQLDSYIIDAIFHDCQLSGQGTVHATYDELKQLQECDKRKMYLTHYGDNFEKFNPENDGFAGFAKEWVIYKF
jgi:ribonuclease BN (tRNA processing enzyme)